MIDIDATLAAVMAGRRTCTIGHATIAGTDMRIPLALIRSGNHTVKPTIKKSRSSGRGGGFDPAAWTVRELLAHEFEHTFNDDVVITIDGRKYGRDDFKTKETED